MISVDKISCRLDLDAEGRQFGSIDLSFSDNRHAFDNIPIPLVTLKNGDGPTLLLSAGNHGDEYEGQVVLRRLIHELDLTALNGRLILLPALNYPAMLDNARVSPLDQGNMNRSFPGDTGAGPTAAIAGYVSEFLLPEADYGIDLHSGGSTAYYLPSAFVCSSSHPGMTAANFELAGFFAAPNTIVVEGSKSSTGLDPAANARGVPLISTELYGGANVTAAGVDIGYRGVKRVMAKLAMIDESVDDSSSRYFNCMDGSEYLDAGFSGIFEPAVELGDAVQQGDLAGRLYSVEEVDRPPQEYYFPRDGIVLVRRNGARVSRGSHLFLVAETLSEAQLAALF